MMPKSCRLFAPLWRKIKESRAQSDSVRTDRGLIRGGAACLDGPGPFFDLALDEPTEILRRGAVIRDDLGAEAFETILHQRVVHGVDGRVVEPRDDRGRRVLGQEERVPRIAFDIEALLE